MIAWTIISPWPSARAPGRRRRKRGAGVEGQEQVIHETGLPIVLFHFDAELAAERHLREQESAVGVAHAEVALMRAAGIEAPVPRCEDQDVTDPQSGGGAQQFAGRFLVERQTRDQ